MINFMLVALVLVGNTAAVAYVCFYYFTTTERGFDYMERRAAMKRNRRK